MHLYYLQILPELLNAIKPIGLLCLYVDRIIYTNSIKSLQIQEVKHP